MSEKLVQALQVLATSPVKQDRLAIERLEKSMGASLSEIISELDNYAIVHQAICDEKSNPKNKLIVACISGCLCGAVIGLAALFVKPNVTTAAIGLGFTAGVSANFLMHKQR